jgi:hypothetical protein
MKLTDDVAQIVAGPIRTGEDRQGFVFLTSDADGSPHAALVSRREMRIRTRDDVLLVALRGAGTRANLERSGVAGLIVIGGETAHRLTFDVVETCQAENVTGYALEVRHHVRDTVGVPLSPITFRVTPRLAQREDWEAVDRLLDAMDA